jgi:hypothetical protein
MTKLPLLLARLLCRLGFHDFRVISKKFGFCTKGGVEAVECRRCGVTMTRQAWLGSEKFDPAAVVATFKQLFSVIILLRSRPAG